MVDDLRGELGFTSSTRGLVSPNLDKLAARGTVFERCCESYLAGDLLIAVVRVSPLLLDKWLACLLRAQKQTCMGMPRCTADGLFPFEE